MLWGNWTVTVVKIVCQAALMPAALHASHVSHPAEIASRLVSWPAVHLAWPVSKPLVIAAQPALTRCALPLDKPWRPAALPAVCRLWCAKNASKRWRPALAVALKCSVPTLANVWRPAGLPAVHHLCCAGKPSKHASQPLEQPFSVALQCSVYLLLNAPSAWRAYTNSSTNTHDNYLHQSSTFLISTIINCSPYTVHIYTVTQSHCCSCCHACMHYGDSALYG